MAATTCLSSRLRRAGHGRVSLTRFASGTAAALLAWLSPGSRKRLLEIGNDIVNVLQADGDADEVLGDTAVDPLLLAQLLVRCGPGVDGQRLRVADAKIMSAVLPVSGSRMGNNLLRQVGDQLEVVHDLTAGGASSLYTKRQHATKSMAEVLLREAVRLVVLKTGVRNPRDVLVGI